jgi:hypothetical protein
MPTRIVFLGEYDQEPEIIRIINQWLLALPDDLVLSREPILPMDFLELWKTSDDPSECVRSADLDPLIPKHFDVDQVMCVGASLDGAFNGRPPPSPLWWSVC